MHRNLKDNLFLQPMRKRTVYLFIIFLLLLIPSIIALMGDVDNDGAIKIEDLYLLIDAIIGKTQLSAAQLQNADPCNNGNPPTVSDFQALIQSLVGRPSTCTTTVKIAFFGDMDSNTNTRAVLNLVKNEGAEALVLLGDLNYQDDPNWMINEINAALGSNYPVFYILGDHENLIDLQNKKYAPGLEWPTYDADFTRRLAANPTLMDCTGVIASNALCHFKGIALGISGVLVDPANLQNYDTYIRNNLGPDASAWKICAFHRSDWEQSDVQKAVEECRKAGAIIMNGHDHAYGRTHVLDSFVTFNIAGTSNPTPIGQGKTLAVISGLGGQGRGDIPLLNTRPTVFAVHATLSDNSNYGALFCEFNKGTKDKASCYFKDITGRIWDQFDIINDGGTSQTPPPNPAPTPSVGMKVGTNIAPLVDWSGGWVFADMIKTARPWVSGERYGCSFNCPVTFPALDLDADGWVKSLQTNLPNGGQVARSVILSAGTLQYLSGEWTITYDGEGTLKYDGGIKNIAKSRLGVDIVDVAPGNSGSFMLTLIQTDPNNNGNYIKNIQVWLPGTTPQKGTVPFAAEFKNNLAHFKVVRFMDAMNTNGAWYKEYDDYPQLTDAFWPAMPAEKIGQLCTEVGCDPWVTIPHLASDNFVQQFAQALSSTLDPSRKVYVEYSNEVWNPGFKQNGDVARLGCPKYSDLTGPCDQDTNPNNGVLCEGHPRSWIPACGTAEQRYFSERSVEIWNIFDTVFGRNRVVHVMASQIGNSFMHKNLLNWNNAYQNTDILATAPYVGGEIGSNIHAALWPLDQLFTELNTVSLPMALNRIDNDIATLNLNPNYANIKLAAYEGGQHLVGIGSNRDNTMMTALFLSANSDPRMKTLYTQYLNDLQSRGMSLFVHFNGVQKWTKFGSWGAKEYTSQSCSASPKCDALESFIAANP